jgi:hypothetical protein
MPDQRPEIVLSSLACSVRSLRRYWLEIRCTCKTTRIPLRMLAAERGRRDSAAPV